MTTAILSKRRVDPDKVEQLRNYFEDLADQRDLFERGLAAENVYTEAAFLRTDERGPVLYYYAERAADHPPEISVEDLDDELVELGARHRELLNEVCVESPRNEDGTLETFETLFFASASDRELPDSD